MSSAAILRPSVFLSYASEDRAAARALRDTLAATGLEVWYDENELGGGDAWDQKIRRQIRDCDYFMPLISAATEARKEGYFRREWRLAAERTLDMADDVMFLLPVSIDGTSELGARVPDKFLSVQWLRLPGGQATPALDALCRRLLAGDHTAPPRPPLPARPPAVKSATVPPTLSAPATPPASGHAAPDPDTAHAHAAPPKAPPFPHVPEKGGVLHTIRFLAEVVWWAVSAAWILFKRAPKWLRVLLTVWLVFFLFSTCGRNSDPTEKRAKAKAGARPAATELEKKLEKDLTPSELAKVGSEIARNLIGNLEGKSGRTLAVVPFALGLESGDAARFAEAVFSGAYGQLVAARPAETSVSPEPLTAASDAALVARGKKAGAPFILAARLTDETPRTLAVRLLRVEDGTVAWNSTFPIDPATIPAVSAQISAAVLEALPKK